MCAMYANPGRATAPLPTLIGQHTKTCTIKITRAFKYYAWLADGRKIFNKQTKNANKSPTLYSHYFGVSWKSTTAYRFTSI